VQQTNPPAQQNAMGALRHVAHKVDSLLEALTQHPSGGVGGGGGAPDPALKAQLEVLNHLRGLHLAQDPSELYKLLPQSAIGVTGANRAFVMVLEEGSKLRFKGGVGVDQQALTAPDFAGSKMQIKRVLQEGRGVCLSGNDLPAHGLIHLKGMICAPLRWGVRLGAQERTQGVIYADSTQSSLGPPQMAALERLAEHASVAAETAHLLAKGGGAEDGAEILRLRDNISKLYDVARSINSTLDLTVLLDRVVDHVVEISRAQRGSILLFEGAEAERQLRYRVGRDSRQRTISEETFGYSKTFAQKAIDTEQSHIMQDAMGGDLSVSMVQMELRSILCVPLKERDKVIGVVYVDSQQSNKQFDEYDKSIVESICGQASVAIINAQLYQQATERERLAHELHIAAKLQADLLPKKIPVVRGLDMYGLLEPALEVGGDYYDFIPHEGTEESLTVAIGDVSGKGVGAGMVMAVARSALRSLIHQAKVPESPLEIVRTLNVMLCRDIPREMFMTLNILIWNATTRCLRYTPCGHEHLIIFRAQTGEVDHMKAGGVAAGVLEQASAMYTEQTLALGVGDHLLLYTDGVTEAMDILHQPMGLEVVIQLVKTHGGRSPQELCDLIKQAVVDFRGAADPHDDITLVALKAV
jgi:serine phosphatase RsbU (regulator of sigma subunit)